MFPGMKKVRRWFIFIAVMCKRNKLCLAKSFKFILTCINVYNESQGHAILLCYWRNSLCPSSSQHDSKSKWRKITSLYASMYYKRVCYRFAVLYNTAYVPWFCLLRQSVKLTKKNIKVTCNNDKEFYSKTEIYIRIHSI